MSVPLPSPSPLSPVFAKPIPRSRPQPIATSPSSQTRGHARSPGRPSAQSPSTPGSPRSASFRKHTARSIGFNAQGGNTGSSEDNWRERESSNGPKSAVRTVGGFEKTTKNANPANNGSASPISREARDARDARDAKDKELNGEKPAVLSHVPCRFYKAGACTAGASCPFSHEEGGKREVCQWFLKGNCKFGHKCALAHVRPGEPMSMDRKNKKAAQLEARGEGRSPSKGEGSAQAQDNAEHVATPVAIRSALSSSIQSPPAHRLPSSPLREPFGPPSTGPTGGNPPGFARSPAPPTNFASSPSRPSPLSGSYGAMRPGVPGPLSLKNNNHSPLRPPTTAFSSSFSHSTIRDVRAGTSPAPPMSASFADGMRRNIWARNESPMDQPEVLSPRRPIDHRPRHSQDDVFDDSLEDDHGEDLLPSSLSELLTPKERARRMSRRDSQESFSASPHRGAYSAALWTSGERLAQSAGPTMGPGFLQGLWSAEGSDARKGQTGNDDDFTFGPQTAQPQPRQSLLTQQKSPISPQHGGFGPTREPDATNSPFLIRALGDPSSPSSKALQEHAPGQSLPGGLASALSRLHLHGSRPPSSGLVHATPEGEDDGEKTPEMGNVPLPGGNGAGAAKREEHEDDALFAMDG